MSALIHYISVMKGKSCTFWIAMAGVFLTARVCDAECIKHSFKEHITNNLLMDHWFQMKNFTPAGEEVTLQHEFLSVLNTICSSVIANKQFITSAPLKGGAQSKVVWTYNIMVKALVKGSTNWTEKEILHFCSKSCSESYGTSFINTTQFEKIYKKVCVWNGTVPACPSLQNHLFTTAVTSQTSTLSPNRNASVQSPNFEAQKTEYHVLSAVVPSLIIIIIMGIIIIIIMGTIIRRQRNSQVTETSQECSRTETQQILLRIINNDKRNEDDVV